MRGSEYTEFKAFVAVAECSSFTRAAKQVDLTASAMSQTIRTLEQRLGVRLLHRTTRSVLMTDAGGKLLARVQPALQELDSAAQEIASSRDRPSDTLRIVTPRIAYVDHLHPILPKFQRVYPDVSLDITINNSITNIVTNGYDLGIRLGEFLEEEVIILRLGSPCGNLLSNRPITSRDAAHHCGRKICISIPASTGGRTVPVPFTDGSLKKESNSSRLK